MHAGARPPAVTMVCSVASATAVTTRKRARFCSALVWRGLGKWPEGYRVSSKLRPMPGPRPVSALMAGEAGSRERRAARPRPDSDGAWMSRCSSARSAGHMCRTRASAEHGKPGTPCAGQSGGRPGRVRPGLMGQARLCGMVRTERRRPQGQLRFPSSDRFWSGATSGRRARTRYEPSKPSKRPLRSTRWWLRGLKGCGVRSTPQQRRAGDCCGPDGLRRNGRCRPRRRSRPRCRRCSARSASSGLLVLLDYALGGVARGSLAFVGHCAAPGPGASGTPKSAWKPPVCRIGGSNTLACGSISVAIRRGNCRSA